MILSQACQKKLTLCKFNEFGESETEVTSFFTWTSLTRAKFTTNISFRDGRPLVEGHSVTKIKELTPNIQIMICHIENFIVSTFEKNLIQTTLSL